MTQFQAAYSAVVDASGRAVVRVRPPRMQVWTVWQVSNDMGSAPIGSGCTVRYNTRLITPLISTGDVASGEPPVRLFSTDEMTVEWESCTPGDVGNVLIFYTEERAEF